MAEGLGRRLPYSATQGSRVLRERNTNLMIAGMSAPKDI